MGPVLYRASCLDFCLSSGIDLVDKVLKDVTVPGKRVLVAQIMIFLYRRFSATTPKINSRDKTFVFVSEVSPTLCLHSR